MSQKVYSVVLHEGEYSCQSWNLMGVFSTEKKAQAYIDKVSAMVPMPLDEEIDRLYQEAMDKHREYHNKIVESRKQNLEIHLQTRQSLLKNAEALPADSYERIVKIHKAQQYGQRAIKDLEREIPFCFQTREQFVWQQGWGRSRVSKSDLDIQENILDDDNSVA